MNPFFAISSLLMLTVTAQAAETVEDLEILAKRGKGIITQTEFTARAEKIPADKRRETLRNGSRLRDVVNLLLLDAQLAEDAREAGFQNEEVVAVRMQMAADAELATAWLQHYVESQPPADYEQLAREYYQLNMKKIKSSPKVDVSHILVSTKDRPKQEALDLALTLTEQLDEDPVKFDELILQYSEDPSAASNKGKFTNVKRGDMVPAFENAAFDLKVGQIAGPVETPYGFHIIRLDARIEPEQIDFETVKQRLMDKQRTEHETRIKQDYLRGLTSLEVDLSEEALQEMVRRLFGEDYVDPYTGRTQ